MSKQDILPDKACQAQELSEWTASPEKEEERITFHQKPRKGGKATRKATHNFSGQTGRMVPPWAIFETTEQRSQSTWDLLQRQNGSGPYTNMHICYEGI